MTAHDMTATITCAGCQHAYSETALFCPNCGRPKVRETLTDPLLGKVLGDRFLVQELLGQGGSGTIYRAEHVTLRRRVAIKVLHTELSRDDLAVERFRREATTVAEIDNEHIVEIHDFGRTPDGRLYLAMELLEGETLDAVLVRENQLSIERAADILIQVGEALMEAHAIGYVHRDLRPRNIYLSVRRGKANFIKLLDFGLAKLVETEGQAASTSLGMTFGDPRYMSPEQARGDRIDRRADIYQLGCVAYEMLTGAPPFSGARVFDILTKQVTEAPHPLPTRRPGVPLWMEAAVTKMLAKDPENRFATTSRMVEALRRGLEAGEVMEDDVARRRESIPPPSVSRVMQRMGMAAPDSPRAPTGPDVARPDAARSDAAPADNAPAARSTTSPGLPAAAMPPGAPPLDPGVTMRAPVVPPPSRPDARTDGRTDGKPDSVELLRRRTGTPRIGVPIMPAPAAPPIQPPVAGVIEPPARAAASEPRPQAPQAPPATPALPATPVEAPVVHARDSDTDVRRSSSPSDVQPRGKRQGGDLAISQVWYDEGDDLAGDDAPRTRSGRGRKPMSASVTDLSLYDERPSRRPVMIAVIGVFAVIGGIMAFAMTRGGSSSAPPPVAIEPVSAVAVIDAAPSTIVSPEPTGTADAPDVAKAVEPRPAEPRPREPRPSVTTRAPAPGRTPVDAPAPRRTTTTAAPTPPPATTAGGYPVLGSEPTRRAPSLGPSTAAPPPVAMPEPSRTPAAPSLTDSPKDPYGADEPVADGVAPEKKAEFFANLGAQQLGGGDTASAAANFKKASELDGKNATAILGLGEIALRQGLWGDAIAHLTRATKLAPRNARAFTLLGEAYLNSGNNTQAAAQFKKALQLDPDNARARDGYNEASSRVPPPEDD
jgi:eukaryotic-like serine/threonine-protein kinase